MRTDLWIEVVKSHCCLTKDIRKLLDLKMNNSIKLDFVMGTSSHQLIGITHSPHRVIICNCYYCSICPPFKQCTFLGRLGYSSEKLRNWVENVKSGRQMELLHLLLNEFLVFSLTSSYRQTGKQASTISWFHKTKVRNTITTKRCLK